MIGKDRIGPDNICAVFGRSIALLALILAPGCASDSIETPTPSGSRRSIRVAELDLGSRATSIVARNGLAYVGCGESGIVIVDVREPRAPEILSRLDSVRADALAYSEDRLFAISRPAGIDVGKQPAVVPIDVVDPRNPIALEPRLVDDACCVAAAAARAAVGARTRLLIGAESRRPITRAIAAEGDTVVALAWRGERLGALTASEVKWLGRNARSATLEFFDAKATPRGEVALGEVSAVRCGEGDVALDVDMAYAVVGSRFFAVALADAANPTITGSIHVPGARSVALGRGFAALGGSSLAIVELGGTPTLADRIDLASPARDVAVLDDFVLVASGDRGLAVYAIERREVVPSSEPGAE